MIIHDNNPERRNLMVASLAFIVYFFAGGSLADNVVRIQIVNIKFSHPDLLTVFAWLMLFWFAYRYWLVHSGNFRSDLGAELQRCSTRKFAREYIEKITGELAPEDPEEGWHIQTLNLSGYTIVANLFYATNVTRDEKDGITRSWSDSGSTKNKVPQQVKLTGFTGRITSMRLFAECFAFQPSFSSYVVPYILFVVAVIAGIRQAISPILDGALDIF